MRESIRLVALIIAGLIGGCGGGGGSGSGGGAPAAVTPATPGVTISPTSLAIAEGAEGTYTVVLDAAPSGNVTVTPASSDAGAATVSGALTFTTGNWNAAQTVTVTGAEEDSADADDESVTVTHAVSGYGSVTAADDVTVTVQDNDVSVDGIYVSGGNSDEVENLILGLREELQEVVVREFRSALGAVSEAELGELGELGAALRLLEQIVLGVIQGNEPGDLAALVDAFVDALEELGEFQPDELQTIRALLEEVLVVLVAGVGEFNAGIRTALDELEGDLGESYGLDVLGVEDFAATGVAVLYDGRVLWVDLGLGTLSGSAAKVDGADISGEVQRLTAVSERTIPSTFSGTAVEDESISLTLANDDGDETPLSLVFVDIHDRASSLASWEGTWVATEDGVSISTMTVDGEGALFRQDTDGCTATGRLAIIDADRNLYEAQLDVTSCDDFDGGHAGFAFLGDASSGGENNRGVLLVLQVADEPNAAMTEAYSRQ